MLPVLDGRKVLRRIRLHSQIPVIMLTARGDDADPIAGLEAGADDYLPKPFNPRELVARIRAVLRRRAAHPPLEILSIGDLEIQLKTLRVFRNGEELPLTGAEFEILFLLVRSVGGTLTRNEIAESALGRPVRFPVKSLNRFDLRIVLSRVSIGREFLAALLFCSGGLQFLVLRGANSLSVFEEFT